MILIIILLYRLTDVIDQMKKVGHHFNQTCKKIKRNVGYMMAIHIIRGRDKSR